MGIVNEFYQELKQKYPFEYIKFFPDKPELVKLFNVFYITRIKNPRTGKFNKIAQTLVYHFNEKKYKILTTSSIDLIGVFAEIETYHEGLSKNQEITTTFKEGSIVEITQKKLSSIKGLKTSYIIKLIRNEPVSEQDQEKILLFQEIIGKKEFNNEEVNDLNFI